MKQVVIEVPKNVVAADETIDSRFYGVDSGSSKGFICRSKYRTGPFTSFCGDNLTNGNTWSLDPEHSNSLQVAIKEYIRRGFSVFEFESYKELFKWLAS
jgi:hypothetical protein